MIALKMVLLDRDGVINRKAPEGGYVRRPEELELLPGVPQAIRMLNERGIAVVVLTNQRGIALGLYDHAALNAVHALLDEELAKGGARLDGIYVCPHGDGQCDCRKPKTGLLEQAFRDFPFANRENSVMVGDSLPDILAGRSFGLRTVFIEGDPAWRKAGAEAAASLADWRASDLAQAVERLLAGW